MSQLTFIQFKKPKSRPSFSPYCVKVELFLKVHGIDYIDRMEMNPHKTSPTKKFPVIVDEGKIICDSDKILDYLIKKFNIQNQYSEDPKESAIHHLVEATLNESFYFPALYSRWVEEAGFQKTMELNFSKVPYLIRKFIGYQVRKNMSSQLYGQGTLRLSRDEIYAKALKDLKAVEAILKEKKYLGGDKINKADCTAFSFLYNALNPNYPTPIYEFASNSIIIKNYVNQILKIYYNEHPLF